MVEPQNRYLARTPRAGLPCWSFWATKLQTKGGLKVKSGFEPPQNMHWQKRFCSCTCEILDLVARCALQLDWVLSSDRTRDKLLDSWGDGLLFPLTVTSETVSIHGVQVPYHYPEGLRAQLWCFSQTQKQKPYFPSCLADLYKPWRFDTPEAYQAEMPNLWVWAINSSCKTKVEAV